MEITFWDAMNDASERKRESRLKIFEGKPGNLLRVANQIATAIFTRHMSPFGVTAVQCCVLEALKERPGLDAASLGNLIAIDPATLTSVLQRLEARGLVKKGPRDGDRRVKELTITDEADDLLEKIHMNVRKVKREILAPLNAEERKQFIRTLELFIERHGED